ncbi:hypothetical protein [Veillonella agrestimuris]|uniref:hypothetical protein n=1 Tax=Veillonella agrestimuris TaxID=2941340 RepID=UPI00203B69AC|nr:hypothetical protein [Veillonella agrestimuris]
MKNITKIILIVLTMMVLLVGCGSEPAKVSIDGEYKFMGVNGVAGITNNTRLLVDHSEGNLYSISLKDPELTNGMLIPSGKASWDEENRRLNTNFGPLYFSWFEYNVINRIPLKWIFNFEGTLGSKSSDVKLIRIKSN